MIESHKMVEIEVTKLAPNGAIIETIPHNPGVTNGTQIPIKLQHYQSPYGEVVRIMSVLDTRTGIESNISLGGVTYMREATAKKYKCW